MGRGGRNPFRAMKLLDTDYCADKALNCLAVVVVLYCIVPVKVLSRGLCLPDVVAGDNEIEQHRNFSETHFPGVAPCRFRLVGHDGGAAWDCRPNVCCPAVGAVKWQLGE